jgi:hypothetical protein
MESDIQINKAKLDLADAHRMFNDEKFEDVVCLLDSLNTDLAKLPNVMLLKAAAMLLSREVDYPSVKRVYEEVLLNDERCLDGLIDFGFFLDIHELDQRSAQECFERAIDVISARLKSAVQGLIDAEPGDATSPRKLSLVDSLKAKINSSIAEGVKGSSLGDLVD